MPVSPRRKAQLGSDLAEIVLGTYNLEKFTVTLGLHPDPSLVPVSLTHENLHQRLNKVSTFGQVLERIASFVRTGRLKTSVLNDLLSRCIRVHETFATYNSIIGHDRRDLVAQLPRNYRKWFSDMERALLGLPPLVHWHLSSCWHLSVMAMLVPIEDDWASHSPEVILHAIKNVPSPNHRMGIILREMEHFDLPRLISLMKRRGADNHFLEAFHLEDEAARKHKLRKSRKWRGSTDWGLQENFEFFIMHAFLDYFEDVLPGLESARQTSSLRTLQDAVSYWRFGDKHPPDFKHVQILAEACNQVIRVLPGPVVPRKARAGRRNFLRFVESSLSKFGCLHVLLYDRHDRTSFDLVHVFEPSSGFVDHYSLSSEELALAMSLQVQIVALSEANTLPAEQRERIHVFVSMPGNPIQRIENFLQRGIREISWWRLSLAHERGPLHPSLGLQLCLYWINSNRHPIFHLSNQLMGNAIEEYGGLLRNSGVRFVVLADKEALVRVTPSLISKFADHPALNYYFAGKTARSSLGI